jgi:CubicO group peptidase (beta-lactamase class C family)
MTLTASEPLPFDLAPAYETAVRYVERGELPAVVFGVVDAQGRREVVAISGRQRVHEDSVIFIASVTKAIIATALMQYVDEGRLDLRSPLSRYLPEAVGSPVADVQPWHVLTHTSGLPDMLEQEIRSRRPTYRDMVRKTLLDGPRWEPGTRYEYNSSAWVLLSELMACLSSMPFPEVLDTRVLRPLGMTETVFDARPFRDRIVTVEGTGADNRLVAEALLWMLARACFPGGGLFGTVPDLLRFGGALLNGGNGTGGQGIGGENGVGGFAGLDGAPRLLSAAAVARMAEPQTAGVPEIAEDGSVSYMDQGIGWRLSSGEWPAGERVITHGGRSGSRLWVDPERGFSFAWLTTLWGVSSEAAIAVLREVYRSID